MSQYIVLVNHPNYEMMVEYPHTIRKISNEMKVSEVNHTNGYIQVNLQDNDKRRKCYKHRLIAEQFIENPNKLKYVYHLNHNPTDNRIDNLIWR